MSDLIARALAVAWKSPLSSALQEVRAVQNIGFPRLMAKLRQGLPVVIVCIGTSSTLGEGYGASGPSKTYPSQFQAKIMGAYPLSTVTVHNKGIAGQTTQQMMERFSGDVYTLNPDLVVWQTGTVDAQNNVDFEDYLMLLEAGTRGLKVGGRDVALMDSQYYPVVGESNTYQKFMWGMAQVCERAGAVLIPRYNMMRDLVSTRQYAWGDLLWTDSFHPSDITYERMAQLAADMIVRSTPIPHSYHAEYYPVYHPAVKVSGAITDVSQFTVIYNTSNPQEREYANANIPATNTSNNFITVELAFYGTGVRMLMPFSTAHSTVTVSYSVDGGAAVPLRVPNTNPTTHAAGYTLTEALPEDWHRVQVTFTTPVSTAASLYLTGFDLLCRTPVNAAALDWLLGKRVLRGLTVTPGTGMAVLVYQGEVLVNGRIAAVSGGAGAPNRGMAIAAADASNPRIDLIYITSTGAVDLVTGTPSPAPAAPAVPFGAWTVAEVRVPAGAVDSAAFTIADKRRMAL